MGPLPLKSEWRVESNLNMASVLETSDTRQCPILEEVIGWVNQALGASRTSTGTGSFASCARGNVEWRKMWKRLCVKHSRDSSGHQERSHNQSMLEMRERGRLNKEKVKEPRKREVWSADQASLAKA